MSIYCHETEMMSDYGGFKVRHSNREESESKSESESEHDVRVGKHNISISPATTEASNKSTNQQRITTTTIKTRTRIQTKALQSILDQVCVSNNNDRQVSAQHYNKQ